MGIGQALVAKKGVFRPLGTGRPTNPRHWSGGGLRPKSLIKGLEPSGSQCRSGSVIFTYMRTLEGLAFIAIILWTCFSRKGWAVKTGRNLESKSLVVYRTGKRQLIDDADPDRGPDFHHFSDPRQPVQ